MTDFDDLIIDESNFDQYFYYVRTNKPKPAQVLVCYEAIAEFVDGNLKRDTIQLLLQNSKAGETAPRIMQKLAGAVEADSIRVVKEMLGDLIGGMTIEEVAAKVYEFHYRHFYYTEKQYIPENDPHWWSQSMIDVRHIDGDVGDITEPIGKLLNA